MRDRQSMPDRISPDHVERYIYARGLSRPPILDCACGIGYGTAILSGMGETVGVDIEPEAIRSAIGNFDCENVTEWIAGDLRLKPWGDRKFRTIVSLETLEHLEDPETALSVFRGSLEPEGVLIASVPNQEVYPFDPRVFAGETYPHRRHYAPGEFEALLVKSGFVVSDRNMQVSKQIPQVLPGTRGRFLVYLASLAEAPWLQTR